MDGSSSSQNNFDHLTSDLNDARGAIINAFGQFTIAPVTGSLTTIAGGLVGLAATGVASRAGLSPTTASAIGIAAAPYGVQAVGLMQANIPAAAQALAAEIAQSAPLALQSTRETLCRGLADAIESATERELVEQDWQRRTADFSEGVKAMSERRLPDFKGR